MKLFFWLLEVLGKLLQEPERAERPPRFPVLIVEDNEKDRELLEYYVSEEGYEFRSVETLSDGQRMLDQESFSCLILDLHFVKGHGMDFARTLWRRKRTAHLPIIYTSVKEGMLDRAKPGDYLAAVLKGTGGESMQEGISRGLRQLANGNGKVKLPAKVALAMYAQLFAALMVGIGLAEIGFVEWLRHFFKTH